jgi:hypothetical protein
MSLPPIHDPIYRDYVLSPEIDAAADGRMVWRRSLWESFYPRVRPEHDVEARRGSLCGIAREGDDCQQRGRRAAVGDIPSRLNAAGELQLHTGFGWQAAPRPIIEGPPPQPGSTIVPRNQS